MSPNLIENEIIDLNDAKIKKTDTGVFNYTFLVKIEENSWFFMSTNFVSCEKPLYSSGEHSPHPTKSYMFGFLRRSARRGRDRMAVGFTTTFYAVSAYHHWCCEFESRSGRGVQHYVIKFVSDLRQVGGFLQVLRFPPPIKLTATI